MTLPQTNPNGELETLSERLFALLFDIARFEIRKPTADKGIDFEIELKKNNQYTGFKFLIQLKATESTKKNTDGSISFSIETKNINYLMNSALPSYYVLYSKDNNRFLVGTVAELFKRISENDPNWISQRTHTIYFKTELNSKVIDGMYENANEHGIFMRKIIESAALNLSIGADANITIDEHLNVTSDNEIRNLIEQVGIQLINEGRWRDLLSLHDKASQQVASSAKYCLIIGIAYLYTGELLKSSGYLRKASQLKRELSGVVLDHLIYFDNVVKYSLGLRTKDEFDTELKRIEKLTFIGVLAKLERLRHNFLNGPDIEIERRFGIYFKGVHEVLDDESIDITLKLAARCDLVLVEGTKINADYLEAVTKFKILGPDGQSLCGIILNPVLERRREWNRKTYELKKEASGTKHYIAFFHIATNEAKVNYEYLVYERIVLYEQTLPGAKEKETEAYWPLIIKSLDDAIEFYEGVLHVENLCATYALKYEIAHYRNDFASADRALARLSELVTKYDSKEFARKLDILKIDGPLHQRLLKLIAEAGELSKVNQAEYEFMASEIRRMQEIDYLDIIDQVHVDTIELHPLGYFQFPKDRREEVLDILNVTPQARVTFNAMLEDVIPIANLFNSPIEYEGKFDGVVSDGSMEGLRKVFSVRKKFFENAFSEN